MSFARADLRQKSRKKKFIAGLTLILLLVLVSLLSGLSSRMSSSSATTGVPVPPAPAALPGVAAHPATSPRSLPRPKLAPAGPARTPAEEIMMEIARYGGSATAADYAELPVAESEPPLIAALSPPPEISGPADYPWPRPPHDSLLLPRLLAGGKEDCPCEGSASPCPENEWPSVVDNDPGPEKPGVPPGEDDPGPEEVWPPIGEDPDPLLPGDPDITDPDGPPPIIPGHGDPGETAPPVPEPATLFLVGTGLACLAGLGRQRKRPA